MQNKNNNLYLSKEIIHLCYGYIRNNYSQYKSFPASLENLIIQFFLFQKIIEIDDLLFATNNTSSIIKPIASYYFTHILTAFIIQQDTKSLSTQIILTGGLKINICLPSATYKLNDSQRYNKIETIDKKKCNFKSATYTCYICLSRNTSCKCKDTEGLIKIYIAPYNQHIINNQEKSYWQQIQNLKSDSILIKVNIDKYINWREKIKLTIISNISDASFVIDKNSERRNCCKKALNQFKLRHD